VLGAGLSGLPPWLVGGLSLAVVFSAVAAVLFVVAERALDDPDPTRRSDRSVSSEDRRRAEIREYLDAIGESYAEDHVVDGYAVAFYLPEHDVAVTFDVDAYFGLGPGDASGPMAVLCEHEMHGHHLGARLPFEVPDVEFGVEPESDGAVRAAFETLDLPTTADAETVRAAYRDRVKEVHPDHGGTEDEFKRVRAAYATASEHADERADGVEPSPARTRSGAS